MRFSLIAVRHNPNLWKPVVGRVEARNPTNDPILIVLLNPSFDIERSMMEVRFTIPPLSQTACPASDNPAGFSCIQLH